MPFLLLTLARAHASAYYYLDSFAEGMGRAGANVAGADDLSAQYYNPAALIRLDRPQVMVNVWTVGQSVTFDRADEPGLDGQSGTADDYVYEPVHNAASWIVEPTIQVGAPLGGIAPFLRNTSFALGMYLPTSPNMAYAEDGAQRYSLVSSKVTELYIGPSLAQRVTPWLTVGAGFQYTTLGVNQELSALSLIEGSNTDALNDTTTANDITIALSTLDPVQFSWNAGLLLQPTPWLDVGVSVQPAISYRPTGTLTTTFDPDHLFAGQLVDDDGACTGDGEDCSFTDDDVTLLIRVPWIVRGGVQVHPSDRSRIELAGTWTDWSSLDELRVTDVDLQLTHDPDSALLGEDISVTDDITLKTGYVDSWSLRLGGDAQVSEVVLLRGGVSYESSAIPTSAQGEAVVDGPKVGLSAGGRVRVGDHLALDLSLSDQLLFAREITTSDVHAVVVETQVTPPYTTTVEDGKVVGNGTLRSNVFYAGVGATVYFGRGG